MKRRGFFGLLAAAVAAPAVAKAEPNRITGIGRIDHDADAVFKSTGPQLWVPADPQWDTVDDVQFIYYQDHADAPYITENGEVWQRMSAVRDLRDLDIITADEAKELLDIP